MDQSEDNDQRRGSSLFAAFPNPPPADAVGPYGRPAYLTPPVPQHNGGNLLVDFPNGSADGVEDMDCDDVMTDGQPSSQHHHHHHQQQQQQQQPRKGEAARAQELMNSQDLPGGMNHRPLVGGFAAAAYEAAKAHHYSMKEGTDKRPQGERPLPPSI